MLVESQNSGSLLNWYKQLVRVRNLSPALRRGTHQPLASSASPVIGYVREYEQQKVLCLINTAPNALGSITMAGSASSLVPGDHALLNLLNPDDTLTVTVSPTYEITGINLDAYEVKVYVFVTATGVGGGSGGVPGGDVRLEQNYPNPFNPSTTIGFVLPHESHITLSVYDIQGRLVKTLKNGTVQGGYGEVVWDGEDQSGDAVSSGVYFYRLTAGDQTITRKTVLLK